MEKTRVFKNGGSVAVRLPKKYSLPVGEVMIDEKGGMLVITPLDRNGWPSDLEAMFPAIGELEQPARPADSKPVEI